MTKIRHFVKTIADNGQGVTVTFQQSVENSTILEYIKEARKSWQEDSMPGDLPLDIINHLKQQRFTNEFHMNFPLHQWSKKNLQINDVVDIDMPLTIDDLQVVTPNWV